MRRKGEKRNIWAFGVIFQGTHRLGERPAQEVFAILFYER